MRVTNRSATRNYLRYLNNGLNKQQKTMEQIDSGYRFKKISDDVASGVKNMSTKASLYKTNVYKSNVDDIKDTLSTAESTMTEIHDLFTELDSKLTKAATDSTSASSRKIYGQQFESTKTEILQLLNTQYEGKYLYGGSNNYSAPFTTDSTGNLMYNGIAVDQIKQRDDGSYYYLDANNGNQPTDIPMNDKVYMDIGLGIRMTGANVDPQTGFDVTYSGPDMLGFGTTSDGKQNNIFNVINQITKVLNNTTDATATADTNTLSELGKQLKSMSSNFLTQITDVGSKESFLTTISNRLEDTADTLDQKMSSLVGTDSSQAAIDQASNTAVVNALYRMGSSVIPTSLMDFIK